MNCHWILTFRILHHSDDLSSPLGWIENPINMGSGFGVTWSVRSWILVYDLFLSDQYILIVKLWDGR